MLYLIDDFMFQIRVIEGVTQGEDILGASMNYFSYAIDAECW